MDLRMETRRQADNNMREISLKVEKIRAKGITPQDLKNLGYVSKLDKSNLNEQSILMDQKEEG